MGSKTGKFILHLNTGVGGTCDHLVHILRMPGERCVQILPYAVSGHESLCRAALFTGTAIQYHGTGMAGLFQPGFYANSRRQSPRSQQIMSAAVTVSAFHKLPPPDGARLLGKP